MADTDVRYELGAIVNLSSMGQRKLKEWIALLNEQGWSKPDKQYLVDYWIEHHDEDGKIKPSKPQDSGGKNG